MPVAIVVGVQWGDEGKGKVVDYLTEQASLVVRFQGGNNAGHTVVIEGQRTALRLIPSGIMRPRTRCLLASGVVIDPVALIAEFDGLRAAGVAVTPERFGISGEAQLILPYHKAIDTQREENRGSGKIGTTGKGIGPCYEDAVSRYGIRMSDLLDRERLSTLVERNVELKNKYLKAVLGSAIQFSASEIVAELTEVASVLRPYICNVSVEVETARKRNDIVVFEGAQGCLLDINHGTYPYVTSSNTVSAFACVSAGFGPRYVDTVLGICKAYCTRVGSGPFPTEESGPIGDQLREIGREYGTVTNRPRRCGWFDAMAVRKAIRLNGIDSLIITKLDVLTGFDRIKIGVGYTLDGKPLEDLPACTTQLEKVKASFEELPGWKESIDGVRQLRDLPTNAQKLLQRIEELVGVQVGGFSVGPDREQTIIISDAVRRFAIRS